MRSFPFARDRVERGRIVHRVEHIFDDLKRRFGLMYAIGRCSNSRRFAVLSVGNVSLLVRFKLEPILINLFCHIPNIVLNKAHLIQPHSGGLV